MFFTTIIMEARSFELYAVSTMIGLHAANPTLHGSNITS